MDHLFLAYTIVWTALFIYIFKLHQQQKKLLKIIKDLKNSTRE